MPSVASIHSERFSRSLYWLLQLVFRFLAVLLYDLRVYGRQHIPDGAALVLSNHQSHFDPVLIGVTLNERMSSVARLSLFSNPLLAAFLRFLNAIELDRDRSGLAGLKQMLARLKQNQKVLIFPEGTRSLDGQIGPLRPGFLVVARRTQATLVPMAITGTFEALPRGQVWPRYYPLRLAVGPIIKYEEYQTLSDAQALELILKRMLACYDFANSLRDRRGLESGPIRPATLASSWVGSRQFHGLRPTLD